MLLSPDGLARMSVRAVQLRVNSRTTRVTDLRWNIGFSLCAAPLLLFLFCISERSEEDREKDKRDVMRSYSS